MENFMTIATAKVATSSKEAVSMNLLRNTDKHTLSRSRLLSDAKKDVISLFEAGYTQKKEREDIKVQGKSGLARKRHPGSRRTDQSVDRDQRRSPKKTYC